MTTLRYAGSKPLYTTKKSPRACLVLLASLNEDHLSRYNFRPIIQFQTFCCCCTNGITICQSVSFFSSDPLDISKIKKIHISKLASNKVVCRTAPASAGLLIMTYNLPRFAVPAGPTVDDCA